MSTESDVVLLPPGAQREHAHLAGGWTHLHSEREQSPGLRGTKTTNTKHTTKQNISKKCVCISYPLRSGSGRPSRCLSRSAGNAWSLSSPSRWSAKSGLPRCADRSPAWSLGTLRSPRLA
eukprot:3522601-Heterocapsa_arctica.AAC.1